MGVRLPEVESIEDLVNRTVNLTPHAVTLVLQSGGVAKIPPSGKVFRLDEKEVVVGELCGIPVVEKEYELPPLENFPELRDPSRIIIVSQKVLEALQPLIDKGEIKAFVVSPDTGKRVVRDTEGRIIGTEGLVTRVPRLEVESHGGKKKRLR
ncbi:MAG: hypothetical protein QXV20_02010 [Candidatus Hadarchaeales archaeon]